MSIKKYNIHYFNRTTNKKEKEIKRPEDYLILKTFLIIKRKYLLLQF